MKLIGATCTILLLASTTALAQAPSKYTVKTYAVGVAVPTKITDILPAVYNCNLFGPTVTRTNVDPDLLSWSDPVNLNRTCQYADPGTGPLRTAGGGNWELTLTPTFGTTTGPESDRVPFSVTVTIAKPTGLTFFKR